MKKIISFMHITLDGFVAGPKGELNWAKVDGEIFEHVGKRIKETDTALYGRVTYQMMESYWPTAADKPTATKHDIEHSKWYSKSHKVVLSKLWFRLIRYMQTDPITPLLLEIMYWNESRKSNRPKMVKVKKSCFLVVPQLHIP